MAEEITLTTIMPSQDVLKVKKGVVGVNYTDPTHAEYMPAGNIANNELYIQGALGIGTTDPRAKLHILKSSTYNSESSAGISVSDGTSDVKVSIGADAVNNIGYIQSYDPATAYTTRPLTLQAAGGKVGIGMTDPQMSLDIVGSAIRLKRTGGAPMLKLQSGYETHYGYIEWRKGDAAETRGAYLGWGDPGTYMDFRLEDGNDLAITGGNVGIGTRTPTATLHVGGISGTDGIKFPDGTLQTTAAGMVQQVNTQTTAWRQCNTLIPRDNSIPQQSEGDQVMSLSITPKAATNKLKIEVVANLTRVWAGWGVTAALFQDAQSNALAVGHSDVSAFGRLINVVFTHYMNAGTTLPTTFKVRVGTDAGDAYFNGTNTGGLFGGRFVSSITITEYQP
jgi:hypothetical protein